MGAVGQSVLTGIITFVAELLGTFVKAQTTGTAFSVDWAMAIGVALAVGFASYFAIYNKKK